MVKTIAVFGEVLFDQFADGSRILGGAPFNVAWHLQAFGLAPCFISRVGQDQYGDEVSAAMREWGMDQQWLQCDVQHPTGAVSVALEAGQPSYAILPQQAYDFVDNDLLARCHCDLLYHGSLALRHPASRQAFVEIRRRHQGLVFLDVNLRAPWWTLDEVHAWLAGADWVKLNDDELLLLQMPTTDLAGEMQRFLERYQLQGLVVTRGEHGAACLQAGGSFYQVSPERQIELVDCVGAGDAFAAVLLLGLAHGWNMPMTLHRAQVCLRAGRSARGNGAR